MTSLEDEVRTPEAKVCSPKAKVCSLEAKVCSPKAKVCSLEAIACSSLVSGRREWGVVEFGSQEARKGDGFAGDFVLYDTLEGNRLGP